MGQNIYYDGNRLLNTKDLDKQTPGIFMICGNRTAGKTFWCKDFMLREYMKTGRMFMILARFGYQLKGISDTFFKDLSEVKYQGHSMEEVCLVQNSIYQLNFDGKQCGYAICLNNADSIKRNSTLFVDVDTIFMDEFQSETGKYCPNEIQKFISIITSVSRGNGKQNRYVRVLMASNNVTLLNPYFYEMKISARIQTNTNILRGKGWVLEITYNENASNALKDSAIGRAFSTNHYMKYSADNMYLNDSNVFVEKPISKGLLECVFIYEGNRYGLWRHDDWLYVSEKYDPNFPRQIALTVTDHNPSSILIKHTLPMYAYVKECFNLGRMRFQNLKCKEVVFMLLGAK